VSSVCMVSPEDGFSGAYHQKVGRARMLCILKIYLLYLKSKILLFSSKANSYPHLMVTPK
jgi:hypothetical protein